MFRNRKEYDDDSYRSDFFLGEMEEKHTSRSHPSPASQKNASLENGEVKKEKNPAKTAENRKPSVQKERKPEAKPFPVKEYFSSLKNTVSKRIAAGIQAAKAEIEKRKAAANEKKVAETARKEAEEKEREEKRETLPKEEKGIFVSAKKPMKARRNLPPMPSAGARSDESIKKDPIPPTGENKVLSSLDEMYGIAEEKGAKKPLSTRDVVRYSVLFLCIFGFFTAAYFVFGKLFEYYRSYVIYSGLQEMVSQKDRFSEEYLKKATSSLKILTPAEVLAGKTSEDESISSTFSEEQETLVNKIAQLKKINADTAGWITIDGTVVNYPVVWSQTKNYYLRRDFYGKKLSSGTIYIDERNSPNITQNRNTVIYGHNMTDGSMFASIHDFASPTIFYGATIQIATTEGIFIYKPFSVHESNAFDNYFETDFVSDEDFLNFCEQMAFISIFETNTTFSKDSQILTLSTCMDNQSESEQRFAVHAILVKVIR